MYRTGTLGRVFDLLVAQAAGCCSSTQVWPCASVPCVSPVPRAASRQTSVSGLGEGWVCALTPMPVLSRVPSLCVPVACVGVSLGTGPSPEP